MVYEKKTECFFYLKLAFLLIFDSIFIGSFKYVSKNKQTKINMKTITLITLFVGALAFITNAYASVSGNLQVTTDYLWRGVTQNGNKAAVNGGLDYQGANFYTGVWISSLASDSDSANAVDSAGGSEANYTSELI